MKWSIHATIISCAVVILGAIALAYSALSNKIDALPDSSYLFGQIHGLHEEAARLGKSQVDMQASLDRIEQTQSRAATQALLDRR